MLPLVRVANREHGPLSRRWRCDAAWVGADVVGFEAISLPYEGLARVAWMRVCVNLRLLEFADNLAARTSA